MYIPLRIYMCMYEGVVKERSKGKKSFDSKKTSKISMLFPFRCFDTFTLTACFTLDEMVKTGRTPSG